MTNYLKEFRAFLLKQNALALAVGVIIGTAIGNVVSGIVEDVFMPLISLVLPEGHWRTLQVVLDHPANGQPPNAIKYGDLLGRLLDFTIIAAVVFFITKALFREKPKPVTTKNCPQCLEVIPLAATRCRACTAELA